MKGSDLQPYCRPEFAARPSAVPFQEPEKGQVCEAYLSLRFLEFSHSSSYMMCPSCEQFFRSSLLLAGALWLTRTDAHLMSYSKRGAENIVTRLMDFAPTFSYSNQVFAGMNCGDDWGDPYGKHGKRRQWPERRQPVYNAVCLGTQKWKSRITPTPVPSWFRTRNLPRG